MKMLLYTNETNPAALKFIISAKIRDKNVEVRTVRLNDQCLENPKHLPYLWVNDDCCLFLPNSAVWYIWEPPESESILNEWLEWESTILSPILAHFFGSNNKSPILKSNLIGLLDKLNASLAAGFLLQNNLTICDIIIWSSLYPLYIDPSLSKEFLTDFVNLNNWLGKIEQNQFVKQALSGFKIQPGAVSYQALLNGAKYPLPTNLKENLLQSTQHDVVTVEELAFVEKAWLKDVDDRVRLKNIAKPVLPKENEKNILITAALPYVNNVPHLGNIIGCVLSADVFARFSRICNYNTLFIGGTDEYGTATETKALEEKLTCQEICDKYYTIHKDIYQWFNISFDKFGRSSTPHQTELCQTLFAELNENGFMFVDSVEQLNCENCNRFLADRFVEGGCPNLGCTYEDARGDQCDGCGKLVNAVELKNPRCKICGKTPKLKTSKQFFIDLPKLEPLVHHWVKISSPGWSNNAQVIAKSWLKEGLKPRCITRDLKWGVPVPVKGFQDKVFYVWFDAPVGYLSITKAYTEKWEQWWRPKTNSNVKLYQFMAKDNVPFHSIMFPACLLGANKGYTIVSNIMATEYLNYEDGKFSKSRGIGVFGNDARDTGIASDVWRFYLLYVRPESQDSSFSWSDLVTKNNSELLNNLGNFINRALVFAKNNFNGTVPAMVLNKDDYTCLALCTKELNGYVSCLEKGKLRDGIRHILSISRQGNQYMQGNQPWVLLKGTAEQKLRAGTIIGVCCNIAALLATLLHPYMPSTSDILKKQLNVSDLGLNPQAIEILQILRCGHNLGEPSPLFVKLDLETVEQLKQKFSGQQNSTESNGTIDEKIIRNSIAKQEAKVKKLKDGVTDKKVLETEEMVLKKLKSLISQSEVLIKNEKPDVDHLEAEISKQGALVRKMKEGGASKAEWQPDVAKLLDLKKQLAALTGVKGDAQKPKKKK